MDYEKKYKDALENAKQEYITTKNVERKQWLEELFPELKESEDELTWLTQFIQEEVYNLSIDIRDNEDRIKLKNLQKSLAWLEKQGEQPSAIRWYDASLIPQEMEELLVEWDSEDATWHEIAFYHADTKTFWNGTRQVKNVTRWCYIIDLFKNEQKPFDYEQAIITQKDDERIRKELINAFSNREKYLIDQSFGDITVSEALAWLKKQGEQKPIISVAYMVSKYASTPEQGNEGFGKPMNCMVRAYRQGILDTLKKIKQNNVVEEQQNITECEPQKFGSEGKDLPDKHQWEDGDIIRLKKDDGVRWQIFKSSESEMLEGWFMSQIMENGIAGGYVNSFILDAKYEFLHNPCKEFLKKS